MIQFLQNNYLWKQGKLFLILIGFCALVALYFHSLALLIVDTVFFVFLFFFFRNPERMCDTVPHENGMIVAPADGKIVAIQALSNTDGFGYKVAIFLSPFDVHVNRAPCSGKVTDVAYHKGKFVPAFLDKSSDENERNDLFMISENNKKVLVRQIAGTLARTIVCWKKEEDNLKAGQRYGMIKFGSRVELFLPEDIQLFVQENQRVTAGETIIGRFL